MAKPIKDTPVLRGEAAEQFLRDAWGPVTPTPESEKEAAKRLYEMFKKNSDGKWR